MRIAQGRDGMTVWSIIGSRGKTESTWEGFSSVWTQVGLPVSGEHDLNQQTEPQGVNHTPSSLDGSIFNGSMGSIAGRKCGNWPGLKEGGDKSHCFPRVRSPFQLFPLLFLLDSLSIKCWCEFPLKWGSVSGLQWWLQHLCVRQAWF